MPTYLLDTNAGQSPLELKGHTALIYHLAFSPDGKMLATASFDNTIKLWEWPSGKEVRTLTGHTGPVYCVAFHPNGTTLASGSLDKTIRLWNIADGKLIREIKGHTDIVDSIAFNKDGKLLASGSSDKSVRLWNPDDGKEVKNLGTQAGTVYSVAFSLDGKWLASTGLPEPGAPATSAGQAKDSAKKTGEPPAIPTGVKIWDVAAMKDSKSLKGHEGPVTGVLFTPDSTGLLTIGMMDRTVRLWNISEPGAKVSEPGGKVSEPGASATGTGKELKKMGPTPDDLYGIAFSRDGKTLATCGYGGHLIVWNLADGKPAWTQKLPYVTYCLAFTPDGKAMVTGHDKPYVCLVTSLAGLGK